MGHNEKIKTIKIFVKIKIYNTKITKKIQTGNEKFSLHGISYNKCEKMVEFGKYKKYNPKHPDLIEKIKNPETFVVGISRIMAIAKEWIEQKKYGWTNYAIAWNECF